MNGCKEKVAVQELIKADTAEKYVETLDQFFEYWLISELTDTADSNERAMRFNHLQQLKKFFDTVTGE